MPVRSRLVLPGALAISLLMPGCAILGPIFGLPPMGLAPADFVIENMTDEPWVLRVVTDAFPQDFAVPAGTIGSASLYAGAPQSIVLLDTDCDDVDELDWTDPSMAVRIEGTGALSAVEPPAPADLESLLEYAECVGGFGVDPAAEDPVPGASGTIVFGTEVGVWEVDPATAEVQGLFASTGDSFDTEHAVSPDGSTIAFTRYSNAAATADLFVADADGANERMLVEDASEPTWSPDGTRLAYVHIDPFAGGPTLNVISLDGGESSQLAEDATTPRWSPDGRRIAFMSVDFAGFNGDFSPQPAELRIVNLDGTGLETIAEASPFAGPPAWSPDGARIAFTGGSETSGTIDVVVVAGGEITTVAEVDDVMLTEPAWSPDGQSIAFAISSASLFSSSGAIGMVSAQGGEIERLGELDDTYFASPVWSPDGAWLTAARASGMMLSADLLVFEVASGDETILATGAMRILSWRD